MPVAILGCRATLYNVSGGEIPVPVEVVAIFGCRATLYNKAVGAGVVIIEPSSRSWGVAQPYTTPRHAEAWRVPPIHVSRIFGCRATPYNR
jgi:hypothetical protein